MTSRSKKAKKATTTVATAYAGYNYDGEAVITEDVYELVGSFAKLEVTMPKQSRAPVKTIKVDVT